MSFSRLSAFFLTSFLVIGGLAFAQSPAQSPVQVDDQHAAATAATAVVPRLIRIQGALRDEAGKPLSGNVGIAFDLYRDENDQDPLWEERQTVQLDSTGHYSALLGVTYNAGLPIEIFSTGIARWLGVRASGHAEQPRILLLSVAYALKAADTEMLGGRPASAYVLANSQSSSNAAATSESSKIPTVTAGAAPILLAPTPSATCTTITSDGTATANQVTKFTSACNIENSAIFESGGNVGIGTNAPAGTLDVAGTVFTRGLLTLEAGGALTPLGTATASQGYTSTPFYYEASVYNTSLKQPVTYLFNWEAEPTGNDSSNSAASMNLLFGAPGAVSETGFSISRNGIVTFASGQTFPASGGTVTNVATGAGLTGGPITTTGTISIASAGVTNAMLANNSVTVKAGTGMSGGGTVALGGTVTLNSTATGTVTSVGSGTGLTGGPITGSGTLNLDTTFTDARYLQLSGGTLTGALNGTTASFSSGSFSGTVTAAGAVMPTTGTATASKGFNSNPFDLQASSFSTGTSKAVTQDFRWMAEPTANDSASPSGSLNLLFGSNGVAPTETGLSISSKGLISFASGQTFPGAGGSGTVTNVATGAGLTGGPITSSGTISIPSAGVTNAMLANNAVTVTAGTGLSGGGTVALGGAVTLNSTNNGTVTTVNTGAGLSGGPITSSGTISIPSAGVTNTMLANNSVTVTAGSGLSGGGTVALGGTVTITNASPSSGGTVTSVATGTGLLGGPITGSGTLSLNTTYTDARYLQLTGGTLTGTLNGTTAAFTGGLGATTGTFSGAVSAFGALLPQTAAATASKGFTSNPFDLQASSFSSGTSKAVTQDFRWQAEPTANNSASPSGTLNLLFGSNGATPAETGLSIASNGVISFAPSQTFPGAGGTGTVTSVNTGAGLTGGPVTSSGTISIPSAGVTNAMLANNAVTVTAGTGLSGGGTVALGGAVTLNSTNNGTVTTVNTGAGLSGGPITSSGTITIPSAGVTNTMLANNSITVKAGTGMSGGGLVALGGTVTLNNASPSSGGTVTSVASGTGITGGPITGSGTLALDTTFTDARYLQLSGGTLSGALNGTAATFTGNLSALGGLFTSAVSEAGALLPQTGTATASKGFNSNALDLQASSFNSTSSSPVTEDFRWQAEPTGNNSSSPSGLLSLLFASNGGTPAETGFSIASSGLVTFAPGQTFPGGSTGGTVTSVNTGAGLTGGPITSSGTISIPTAGVSNGMLANPSITIQAGSGLSGGGTVALGGTVTLNNTSSGGTVTSVSSGTGLTGGPITTTGTLNLDTSFTDARYLQLSGGILSGSLTGTTAAFTGGIGASTGTFTGSLSAAGAFLPQTGAATSTAGFNSSPLDVQASSYNSSTSTPVTQDFQWIAEPTGNNSSNPSGSLNLLFGSNGSAPAETGLSIASNGLITFASGQTFPGGGSGSGTVTTVNTGAGLTGGPITSSGTISIPAAGVLNSMLANPFVTVQAGSGLSGGGTVALGGTVTLSSNLSGTTNGVAYFSNPTTLTSTAAPTNGQVMVGSTGNAPVLSTLTAGSNVTITNSPGSITISATGGGGGSPTLPFFALAGARNGGSQALTANVNKLFGFLLPYNVITTEITYTIMTTDNTANNYDLGIFNSSGTLILDLGATPGTTFSATMSFHSLKWTQGSTTLPAGKYYFGITTNCKSACAAIGAVGDFVSFVGNVAVGATTGGALSATITPPADSWVSNNQPTVIIQ